MSRVRRETVKIEARFLHETDKAWLFQIGDGEWWIPKSMCQWELHDGAEDEGTVEMQKWFADKEEIPH